MTAPFDVHVFEEKQPFKDFKEYVNVVDEDYTINKAIEFDVYKEPKHQMQNYFDVQFYDYDPVMKLSDYNEILKLKNMDTIYSQDNETNILLVIEDNGCGIKASDLSRVFEKGFTGSNRNKANATGMGLYLSKKLSDRLGLKLDITSKETEYTRLTITFPKGTVHNLH